MANVTKPKTVLGWWFCAKDEDGIVRLPHGDGREVKVAETLAIEGPIRPCERGLHASRRALDALQYAPGEIVYRVRLSGEIVEENDKLAASARTVLWMADAARALHEFAVWCAREALLRERRAKREPDPRSWRALDVKLAWLDGKATKTELAAAGDAAWDAAWTAARDAAWDAARAVAGAAAWAAAGDAAWDAARTAARAAAWDAAWDAARTAARTAAWTAARDAAWDAAWDAARDAENKRLELLLSRLSPATREGQVMTGVDTDWAQEEED